MSEAGELIAGLSRLQGWRPSGEGRFGFVCPVDDQHGEATLWVEEQTVTCPGGCTAEDVLDQAATGYAHVTRPDGVGVTVSLSELDQGPPECSRWHPFGYDRRQCLDCMRRVRWVGQAASDDLEERLAAALADEWAGTTGDLFDPEQPEPMPCVLETSEGRFIFTPGIHVLFGARSSLKTWLAYQAGVQETRRGNRVLLLDYELSYEESMRRFHTLGMTEEERARLLYVHPSGAPSEVGRRRLLARFADQSPSLIVLDSTGMGMAAAGLDENVGANAAIFSLSLPLWLKTTWPEAVILLIDHLPKGSDEGTDPIGSQRKGAVADGLYLLRRLSPVSRTTRGWGRLFVHKDRRGWADEGSEVLDFEFGGGGPFVVRPPDPQRLPLSVEAVAGAEDILVRIARYVGDHEGVKVAEARQALGVRAPEFTAAVKVLVGAGAIVHPSRQGLSRGERWAQWMADNG